MNVKDVKTFQSFECYFVIIMLLLHLPFKKNIKSWLFYKITFFQVQTDP